MKTYKITITIFFLSLLAFIFSGCGGGNPVIPPIEDEEQEYVVEEKSFNVDADKGGTFSLSDGTELKIDPGDLSDDAYVVLKRVRYNDLDFSKSWWADENPYVWFVNIFGCGDMLGNVELYMVSSQLEYIGGKISGGIVRLKDGAFELVNEFTASIGEKVLVSIEEIGKTAYLFVTNPINDVMIVNDLVEDIGLAVQYYYDGNCTSLYNLYQQALQEESTAENDLKNHPGVTKEDSQEIFDKVFSLKSVIDFAVGLTPVKSGKFEVVSGTAFFSYKIYSAVVGIGEICKYTNAYMIAKNKADIYSSKIFKRRVIKYFYEQDCIGNDEEEIKNVINDFFQALSDQKFDEARSYCIYGSAVYNGVATEEDYWYFDESNGMIDTNYYVNIVTIIVDEDYAEVNIKVNKVYVSPCGEAPNYLEICISLKKSNSDWKLYSSCN